MMEPGRYSSFADAARAMRRITAALTLALALGGPASAQPPAGVYAPGEAAVTGFSGAVRPSEIAPGQDPDAQTFIDPEGPSLRVVDLGRMGGPPAAQFVGAPKPFTVSAKWIGQVFGVALDDNSPANIYVAATSAYGLAIVAPGPDGRPQHIGSGAAGATFMPAQWGPRGGPGSIWRIDGATGQVTLFADVVTGGKANSGAALGALAYDPGTKSLFVADRETGLIHRFGLNGADLGVYDHGVAGPAAVGLPPAPAKAAPGVDIASPAFDSARPETWGYAAPERRVFGLATHDHRLYYAVADGLRVWSVGLNADGSFGSDARIEVAAPPAAGPTEISRITFDDEGRMYLAERPAPTGAQDFEAVAAPAIGRVLRYAVIGVTATKQPIWQPLLDEYAVGFPEDFRNDNGGVAIGYSYDGAGRLDLRSCGGFLWTTGEQLRNATDPKLAASLGQKDALAINGLQGNPVWRIRRDDEPPRISYFVDYADAPFDPLARGHMGDIAILRACVEQPAQLLPGAFPPGAPRLPPPSGGKPPNLRTCQTFVCGPGGGPCPVNQVWSVAAGACAPTCAIAEILVNGKCCSPSDLAPGGACAQSCAPPNTLVNGKCCSPSDLAPGGACSKGGPSTGTPALPMCGATQTAIGPNHECCDNDHIYSDPNGGQLCCASPLVNGKCEQQLIPKLPKFSCPGCCASGYVAMNGACCLKSQATSTGQCCPIGQTPSSDGTKCQPFHWLPLHPLCCAGGYVPTANGKCCAVANLTSSGECCPAPVNPNDRKQCPTQAEKKTFPPLACGPGEVRDEKGACVRGGTVTTPTPVVPILPKPCLPGERRDEKGACVKHNPPPTITPVAPAPRPRHPPTLKFPGGPARVLPRPIVCPPGWVVGPFGKRCWPPAGLGGAGLPSLGGGARLPSLGGGAGGGANIFSPIRRQ